MIHTHRIYVRVAAVVMAAIILVGGMPAASVNAAVRDNVSVPNLESECGILYSVTTDEVIYKKRVDVRIDPYSITKLMTCLVAAEHADLDKVVKVDHKATTLGGSTMFLSEGEKVTVEQLMYGALIMSGNDSAYMLGIATCGNTKDFVAMMNEKAANLGCTNTHFVNASGLQAKKHYTTAEDYLLVAKAAFDNETVRKIAGTKRYEMAKTNVSEPWTMETHVDLLDKKDSGVVAGKTGYWEDDDCSVVLLYDKKGLSMILVLLGSNIDTRAKDAKKLLQYGVKKVVSVNAVTSGEELTTERVKHGASTRVVLTTDQKVVAYPKSGELSDVERKYHMDKKLEAPLKKGEQVGICTLTANNKIIAEVPLLVSEDVETGWLPSYLYISNNQTLLLGAGLLLLIIILIMRRVKIRKADDYLKEAKH